MQLWKFDEQISLFRAVQLNTPIFVIKEVHKWALSPLELLYQSSQNFCTRYRVIIVAVNARIKIPFRNALMRQVKVGDFASKLVASCHVSAISTIWCKDCSNRTSRSRVPVPVPRNHKKKEINASKPFRHRHSLHAERAWNVRHSSVAPWRTWIY